MYGVSTSERDRGFISEDDRHLSARTIGLHRAKETGIYRARETGIYRRRRQAFIGRED
jgi:hypothetical protein